MAFSDMSSWLGRKYDILQQQADTARLQGNAQVDLTNAQTAQVGRDASSKRGLEAAQGNVANATAGNTEANTGQVPLLAGSEAAQRFGAANQSNAEAGFRQFEITPNPGLDAFTRQLANQRNSPFNLPGTGNLFDTATTPAPGAVTSSPTLSGPSGRVTQNPNNPQQFHTGTADVAGYKDGKTKVPGKGPGTVDKVPATLAPGEAVLNSAAAEHLGRGTIDLLNAIGMQKMGTSPAPQATEDSRAQPQQADQNATTANAGSTTQGFSKGTSNAKPAGKSAPAKGDGKAPGKPAGGKGGKEAPGGHVAISPHVLAALMQMGQGGGGMPSPQGQAPMPMPMPQVAPQQQQMPPGMPGQ